MINVHYKETNNIGDIYSAAFLYFDFGEIFDIKADKQKIIENHSENEIVVFGGGCLISLASKFNIEAKNKIIWGAGRSQRNAFRLKKYTSKDNFLLYGIRDYNVNLGEWVPCPSCMSNVFDKVYNTETRVVVYGHNKVFPLKTKYPYLDNSCKSLEDVIKFLSYGEIVVTSSFHGAYWATLLNKKVIVIPFGSKFFGLKHYPRYVFSKEKTINESFIKEYSGSCLSYPFALEECRERNIMFSEKVKKYI